jgi:hypothetical protein
VIAIVFDSKNSGSKCKAFIFLINGIRTIMLINYGASSTKKKYINPNIKKL